MSDFTRYLTPSGAKATLGTADYPGYEPLDEPATDPTGKPLPTEYPKPRISIADAVTEAHTQ